MSTQGSGWESVGLFLQPLLSPSDSAPYGTQPSLGPSPHTLHL